MFCPKQYLLHFSKRATEKSHKSVKATSPDVLVVTGEFRVNAALGERDTLALGVEIKQAGPLSFQSGLQA